MSAKYRVVDAGLREGRYNIALDQAMLELHQAGAIPDSLRFIHFLPVALIGRHQELSSEVDLDYCRGHGIGVGRRITGGGAIYLDQGQLGWELVFGRRSLPGSSLADIAREICEAAATGLRRLGVDARFRPRNDIEVDGRKLSGTGGFFDGDSMIYQGTVLVDMDPEAMVGALRIPRAKIAKRGLDSAAARVVTLRELGGGVAPAIADVEQALLAGFQTRLGLEFERGALTEAEETLARDLHASQIGRDDFVAEIDGPPGGGGVQVGVHAAAGGTITSYLRREGAAGGRVGHLLITGDFFVAPPRLIYDLESHLRGIEIDSAGAAIDAFFAARPAGVATVTAADFRRSLEAALAAPAAAAAPPAG
ncbi:MAG: lipoate--protein ligase family protein [Gammaproteobacteria bacterium]|nr:lipoate--protein ligase family protein [Gammaproteobacteria bacterium]MDE2349553.1 lipoate--protein ligase family protein [Gammaproteobacteria bacterium]